MNEANRVWRCDKCNKELEIKKASFEYMGRTFDHEVPVCPVCGKVFISEELAKGKMAEVETLMEDK
ncbi:MAG: hypothetical protein IKG70_06275 [Lachnospiraceae bacterium]|nr:hypothetical protein [Lachnospiraceae bacterium]